MVEINVNPAVPSSAANWQRSHGGRKKVAHGASRGILCPLGQAPDGAKEMFRAARFSVAPAGARWVGGSDSTARAVGYFRMLLRSFSLTNHRDRHPFAVGLVVAVPAAQGGGAGVGKKKWQRR